MTARRRRALAYAVGALVVAAVCAALSSNADGGQRTGLLVLTIAWLVIAAIGVANALRTVSTNAPLAAAPQVGAGDEPA